MVSKQKIKTIGMLIPKLLEGEVEGWRNMGWAGVTTSASSHALPAGKRTIAVRLVDVFGNDASATVEVK